MSQTAEKLLTFEDFVREYAGERCELVNGRPEELPLTRPLHSWTGTRFAAVMDAYLEQAQPDGFWGVELDIPTIQFHGRRPDFAFYGADAAEAGLDLDANRVLGAPTLVVEIVSPDDSRRDLLEKRREYAEAGIPHYWILDPEQRTALLLALREGRYEVAGQFSNDDVLTSELFPGLVIPLRRLFRSGQQ